MALTFWDFAINFFIIVGSLILVNFLQPYLMEKGKNLATKEDISQITEEIEGVKIQYITSVEKLRAELQLMIKSQSDLNERSINSLIELYENCCAFLFDKFQGDFMGLQFSTGHYMNEFKEFLRSLHILEAKTFTSTWRVYLYFSEEKALTSSVTNLMLSFTKIRKYFVKVFKLHEEARSQASQIDPLLKSQEALDVFNKPEFNMEKELEEFELLLKEANTNFKKFTEVQSEYLKKIGLGMT